MYICICEAERWSMKKKCRRWYREKDIEDFPEDNLRICAKKNRMKNQSILKHLYFYRKNHFSKKNISRIVRF